MATFPEGMTLRTVTGSVDPGTEVLFRIPVWISGPTDDMVYGPQDIIAQVDGAGTLTAVVPVNDDPQWSPFQYFVRMQKGTNIVKGAMDVPSSAPSYDLADLLILNQPPTPNQVDYLDASDIGARVAALVDGLVPSSQLPAGGGGGGSVAWVDITGKPSTFPPSAHTHVLSDVTGLGGALASKANTADLATVATTGSYNDLADKPSIPSPAPVQSVAGKTGIVTLNSADVGLGNVTNTSDANKPVSTAQQAALDLKAPLASPALTGTPTAPTATAGTNTTQVATTAFVTVAVAAGGGGGGGGVSSVNGDVGPVVVLDATDVGADAAGAAAAALASAQTYADTNKLAKSGGPITGDLSVSGYTDLQGGVGVGGDLVVGGYTSLQGVTITGDVEIPNIRVTSGFYLDGTAYGLDIADVGDSTTVGRAVVTAVDAAAGRTAIGAGTSNLALGTTGTTAAAGNDSRLSDARTPTAHAASHASAGSDSITISESQVTNLVTDLAGKAATSHTHTASQISDSTTVGRAVLTAVDAAAGRTAIGAGTSNLAIGTGTGTAAEGNDSRIVGAAQKASNLSDLANAGTARTNLGLGGSATLNVGTAAGTVAAGDHNHTGTYQPLDSDLTTIAGLTATDTNTLMGVAGVWASRTPAQAKAALAIAEADVSGLVADLAAKQPLDSDLTTIASLTATTNNFMVAQTSAWASVTPATAKTALGLTATDVGLGNVTNTSDANKPVSTAQQTALNLKADLASPTFTGTPTLPTGTVAVTQTAGNSTTAVATTAFVTTADNLKAPLASPTFTGTPSLPTGTTGVTQTAGNNTTALATTAFVAALGALKADLASPTFTGTPAAPTAALGTNTTQLATTAFVKANAAGINTTSRVLNVLDYGADPTGVADSTTAIQNALTAAAPSSAVFSAIAMAVYVPPGIYITGPLSVPHRVTFFGSGRGSRLIMKSASASRAVMITNQQNYSGVNDAQSITVRDMLLDGSKSNNASTWQTGILLLNDTPRGTFEWTDGRHVVNNVLIQNFTGDGLVQEGRGSTLISDVQVYACDGFGVNVAVDNALVNVDVGGCGLDGFVMRGTNTLASCKAWYCGSKLTSSNANGVSATATTVTPPTGNYWSGGSLTGGYLFSLANGWGNGFTWRDPSNVGASPNGNYSGGVASACNAQDNAGSGFYINGGRITLNACEADSNSNNGTSNGLGTGTSVRACAGFTLNPGYNCTIVGTAWDRAQSVARQAAALFIGSGGTGARVQLGFEGFLNNGTDQMPPLLAGSDTLSGNMLQFMSNDGGFVRPSFTTPYTPDPFLAETHQMTITGAITINAPKLTGNVAGAGIYLVPGMRLRMLITQDATGSRVVTWNAVFRLNSKTVTSTANSTTCIEFIWDGTNWQAIS